MGCEVGSRDRAIRAALGRSEREAEARHEGSRPATGDLKIEAARELERNRARTIEVRRDAAEWFDRELRAALSTTVWHTGCTSWYIDENGNDPNQWPWTWSTYRRRTSRLAPGAYQLA